MQNNPIGILGYGRFGRLLHKILGNDHDVFFFDPDPACESLPSYRSLQELIKLPVLFLCVPIHCLEKTLIEHADAIEAHTVMDVCSVKVYPVQWMLKYLPDHIHVIATHPVFGPDSFYSESPNNMMMHAARSTEACFQHWCDYFTAKHIQIRIMTPEQHDQESAYSQGVTHVVGRVLGGLDLQPSEIATKGYASLLTIVEQTCNDSWDLFHDMIAYNPYGASMLEQLQCAIGATIDQITPNNGVKADGQ